MATNPERRLDEMFETVLLTSQAFHGCPKTDPRKGAFADASDVAVKTYGEALIAGLIKNSPAVEGAMDELDRDNTVARQALATAKTTVEILAKVQKAVDAGIRLLALAA
jgi:hypothetical protein